MDWITGTVLSPTYGVGGVIDRHLAACRGPRIALAAGHGRHGRLGVVAGVIGVVGVVGQVVELWRL